MSFHSIKPSELDENLFQLISKDWFLIGRFRSIQPFRL